MILKNEYFIDEIFIPHAKASITDDVTAVGNDILAFIEVYEEEALVKCLGYQLYKEFVNNIDISKSTLIKEDSDLKWDKLLNGTEYTNQSGELVFWKGIRWKSRDTYNKSFLADYVYYNYEKSNDDDRVGIGNVKQEGNNSTVVSKTPKVIAAWRRFFAAVQGGGIEPSFVQNKHGVGIDWYGSNNQKTLYGFINDMNNISANTYPNFKPHSFYNANQFGI